jgi:hypothetical protein
MVILEYKASAWSLRILKKKTFERASRSRRSEDCFLFIIKRNLLISGICDKRSIRSKIVKSSEKSSRLKRSRVQRKTSKMAGRIIFENEGE